MKNLNVANIEKDQEIGINKKESTKDKKRLEAEW